MENINRNSAELIITGDFNLHIDQYDQSDTARFRDLLSTFGLSVRVNGPALKSGHTLDLVITRQNDRIVNNIKISDLISNHMSIVFDINMFASVPKTVTKHFRPIKDIDLDRFNEDLKTVIY